MSRNAPADLVADLSALVPRPDAGARIWRHPALALRLYGPAAAHALSSTEGRNRVLDVGCGFGSVALELARAGRDVTALDPSTDACTVARRTLASVPATVLCASFDTDELRPGSFDAVRFGRSLHHVADVGAAAERAAMLLAPGGIVIVDEFCTERIDRPTARWIASLGASLRDAGVGVSAELADADAIFAHWAGRRERLGLATGPEMWRALEARFVLREPDWYPYLWQFPAREVADAGRADMVARQVEEAEAALIAAETIPGAAFRTVGTVR